MDIDANFKKLFDFKAKIESLFESAPEGTVADAIKEIVSDIGDVVQRVEQIAADVEMIKEKLGLAGAPPKAGEPKQPSKLEEHVAKHGMVKPDWVTDEDWALYVKNLKDAGLKA